jgi:hypothetical protein
VRDLKRQLNDRIDTLSPSIKKESNLSLPVKKITSSNDSQPHLLVLTGLRESPDPKRDEEIIQQKLDQLQGSKSPMSIVKWNRMGSRKFPKKKLSSRPRPIVLTFDSKENSQLFLNQREKFLSLDGAIRIRKFRTQNEIIHFKLKKLESRSTMNWPRLGFHRPFSHSNTSRNPWIIC